MIFACKGSRTRLEGIFSLMLAKYGRQGWWPLLREKGDRKPKDPSRFSINDRFEICAGAILTQNTSWKNVELALGNLSSLNLLSPGAVLSCRQEQLAKAIMPAGYYNQKAKKLRIFAKFFQGLEGRVPERGELLSLWGIGPETADSMLLYAWGVPVFVIDSYTRRMFAHLGIVPARWDYEKTRSFFEANLERDSGLFCEWHALIVAHCKLHYSKKPYGASDFLAQV